MTNFGLCRVAHRGETLMAVLTNEQVIPLDRLLGDPAPRDFEAALVSWEGLVEKVQDALVSPQTATGIPAAEVEFMPPTVARPSVWCAGANYHDHVAEMGAHLGEPRSFHFLSPATVLAGHGTHVRRPAGVAELDWEVELAAVIGRRARDVDAGAALNYVAGYTVANDVSIRDASMLRHPLFGIDWTSSKNADTLTPVGPALVPARFVPDPGNLDVRLSINGALRQNSNTSQMIVPLSDQIAALSRLITLQPGDIILTGTPAGTAGGHDSAYLRDGDEMVASIGCIGTLQNIIA